MGAILSPKTGYIDYKNGIFENDVNIYMILGQRSDGKTYGILQNCIESFSVDGIPSAYVRRFDESLKRAVIQDLCKPQNKTISRVTRKKWTDAVYKSKRFYFARPVNDKMETSNTPFLYAYSLNTWENSKGADSGEFKNIIFDEYVSASKYLPNEYSIFENVLSSILRNRGKTRLIMLGNPINQICPYFDEFNINPHKLKPGDVVYRVSKSGYKLKFVYVPPMDKKHRKTAGIFDFKDSSSITTGYWEFGEFPHVPNGLIKNSDKLTEFAIMFRQQFAVCEFYYYNGVVFCFWRPGNGDKILENSEISLFSDMHIFQHNVYTAWGRNQLNKLYTDTVAANRQYFADNRTGNLVKQWYNEFVMKAGRFI